MCLQYKPFENTVGKGEIAQVLENTVGKGENAGHQLLTTLEKKALENTVKKGKNAGNQHFLHFLKRFLLCYRKKSSYYREIINV